MSRLLDPKKKNPETGELEFPFDWKPSINTDVRATFERVRNRQKAEAAARLKNVIQRRFSK